MKTKRFTVPLYDVEVIAVTDDNMDACRHRVERFIDDTIGFGGKHIVGFAISKRLNAGVAFKKPCSRRVVLHECYHLTHEIIRDLGGNTEDEELNALLHEYVTDKVLDFWESS